MPGKNETSAAIREVPGGILFRDRTIRRRLIQSWFALVALLCLTCIMSGQVRTSENSPSASIAPRAGWYEIPNTQLAPLCPKEPAIEGNTGCRAVINAWNGGIADTKRNRLIIWGGGHSDYFGNEVYGLDLNTLTMSRMTDPSAVTNVMSCPEAYSDGRPSARHTYNGLAYLAGLDVMFVYGGSKSICGFMSGGTWIFDLTKMEWKSMDPHGGDNPINAPGAVTDYDPNTGALYLSDTASLFRYDPNKNTYTRLKTLSGVDYHLSGIIDPNRKLFLMMGGPGQLWVVEIRPGSKYTQQDWSHKVTGCDRLLRANYPGLAYDPVRKQVVSWAGGDTVYLFDPDTRTCSSETYPGGPGPAQANGTLGRFRYFPELGVYALVNDWKQNAFLLRLGPSNAVAAPTRRSDN